MVERGDVFAQGGDGKALVVVSRTARSDGAVIVAEIRVGVAKEVGNLRSVAALGPDDPVAGVVLADWIYVMRVDELEEMQPLGPLSDETMNQVSLALMVALSLL